MHAGGWLSSVCVSTLALSGFANPQTLLDEDFATSFPATSSGSWSCDAPMPVTGGWLLANSRVDFPSAAPGNLEIAGGTARLAEPANNGSGGYAAFYHPLPGEPAAWRITTVVRANVSNDSRNVPNMFVRWAAGSAACPPLFAESSLTGWNVHGGQELVLYDDPAVHSEVPTGYTVTVGQWHTVELTSTPSCSEIRAWPTGSARPEAPLATGASCGAARRVHFHGPNFLNFDYEVDSVEVVALPVTPATYCTGKTNACGPGAISFTGVPSASSSSGFVVTGAPPLGGRIGVLLYNQGPAPGAPYLPFGGGDGFLCMEFHALRHARGAASGGIDGACGNGAAFAVDMNAFAAGALGGFPSPYLATCGSVVHCQWWGRESPGSSFLTDAMEYTVGP